MAGKFYAVRKGKATGIFHTWDSCKAQVYAVPGAEYKSFKTETEARNYLSAFATTQTEERVEEENCGTEAYVDGSYKSETQEFSYGMIVLRDGEERKFAEKFTDKELAKMHNVAGEIKGAEAAMHYAIEESIDRIRIYHDYEGIAKWCQDEWKATKDGTKAYKAFYDSIKDKVAVTFIKVTGHSNNKYNDIADELAKQALGLIGEKHKLNEPVITRSRRKGEL
ncbi:MAG: ribonuclease H family protein [Lachnospiraceae bacterium]